MASPFIVFRRAPDLPENFRLGDMEGKWMRREDIPPVEETVERTLPSHLIPAGIGAVAVPTGRYETNEAGQAAEIYEVRV